MSENTYDPSPVLSGLKDFQKRTVNYVFENLFNERGNGRFLVADEVGLGKTLVARGVIAKALERLSKKDERIDIIYICSNAAIATQNIKRLNVSGDDGFTLATRLTLLPTEVHQLAKNRVNFVSFTPGTTFDLKSKGGKRKERALLYHMLSECSWNQGKGLMNMLQGAVREKSNWRAYLKSWDSPIDPEIKEAFQNEVESDSLLLDRIVNCCAEFSRYRKNIPKASSTERYSIIGELRQMLAKACLSALKPDLVILDEFQRFKSLLSGDDDAALLARSLFQFQGVRTLLLSATPYKMLTLENDDDDHYGDFLKTLEFLTSSQTELKVLEESISKYRKELFASPTLENSELHEAKNRVQSNLMKFMCRTERVGMTKNLDAMLVETRGDVKLTTSDLDQAVFLDTIANSVGAMDQIEYWKSIPYSLSFTKNYDIRRKIDSCSELIKAPTRPARLCKNELNEYANIDLANPRMRILVQETLDKGLWKLLWMPPSYPYYRAEEYYKDVEGVTKTLVFSSWSAVPDSIACLASYEAEKRMVRASGKSFKQNELYDKLKPLLRYAIGKEGRLTGMPVLAWSFPSPTLASAIDPINLSITNENNSISSKEILDLAHRFWNELLDKLPNGNDGQRQDERWYWAALAQLDNDSDVSDWCESYWGWASQDREDHHTEESGSRFNDHVSYFIKTMGDGVDLGPRPGDLGEVLALLSLAGPGCCALRALKRIAPDLSWTNSDLLDAASRISEGFRTLFNLPESIALVESIGTKPYWRLALEYALDGNIQAVLDEQVHILVEQLGLTNSPDEEKIEKVAEAIENSMSIRTAQVGVDEVIINGGKLDFERFNSRCRFAVRYGDLKDSGDQPLARAEVVRAAFNSPFRPFILASTSIGQEGLDFHTWCHSVVHWNLPSNPVDLEQREGRVHRYKGHAVRKNIATKYGKDCQGINNKTPDPWEVMFQLALENREEHQSELVPFWIFEEGEARIERKVLILPMSKEVGKFNNLKKRLALYRLVFGQPRQEDLLSHLSERMSEEEAEEFMKELRISLAPPDNQV